MQDSINKIRRYDIDLLKFIACVMVVILHGIEHNFSESIKVSKYQAK